MKRTPEQWQKVLELRKQRFTRFANAVSKTNELGDNLNGLLANECRMMLQAYYRSDYGWVWHALADQMRSRFRTWRDQRQFQKWEKEGLTEEQVDAKIMEGYEQAAQRNKPA